MSNHEIIFLWKLSRSELSVRLTAINCIHFSSRLLNASLERRRWQRQQFLFINFFFIFRHMRKDKRAIQIEFSYVAPAVSVQLVYFWMHYRLPANQRFFELSIFEIKIKIEEKWIKDSIEGQAWVFKFECNRINYASVLIAVGGVLGPENDSIKCSHANNSMNVIGIQHDLICQKSYEYSSDVICCRWQTELCVIFIRCVTFSLDHDGPVIFKNIRWAHVSMRQTWKFARDIVCFHFCCNQRRKRIRVGSLEKKKRTNDEFEILIVLMSFIWT